MQVLSDLRALWPLSGFRRLFAVRLVSQSSDGMFQVGLATLFFFSPENASTATGVAAAFAVLLLPFTIVGPWAGVLLDRWRRRQVLLWGNLVRVALTLTIAVIMLTVGVTPAVYVLALITLSVNRFLLSALSASLPKVVDGPLLLTANSLTPTLGAAAAGAGGAIGFLLGLVLPTGRVRDAISLLLAAAVMACASALATRLGPEQLGPDERAERADVRAALAELARGLVAGARWLVARRTPAQALGIMALHRFCYGAVFIASILISRNLLSDPADADAGLKTFGLVLGASAVGFALAVVLTPVLSPRTGPHRWVVLCLGLAVVSQLLLAVTVARWAVLACALALGLAAQGAKIAVDTIVQRDTVDAYRGRAFSLYDVLYNAAFVGAAALAAVTLPDTGWSRPVFVALAVVYALGAVAYAAAPHAPAPVGRTSRQVAPA
ncbi:MFS transporter [Cellulomonas shaoxiangyii]|uniref:MFS transporter n=1 Tax=Cellulomonas shaoxiangyii TaxID=2566013 RepID=A0A4P7SLD8_9CELL|nr:MFS transporter [Cellulomonas shaoxiangyii]QCB95050.1 MFS transporter [Cellulomonas shaoxiangyii]TGY86379.1 MFS transporter [Cellulomonas shaoxiangyii]